MSSFAPSCGLRPVPFRSRIDVVQVTVAVTDAGGRLITGLTQEDFQVFEDGIEQTITQFTDKRVPVSLGMLLDASDSMRGQAVIDARDAFDRFVGDLLLTEDEVFVATFNHLPRLVTKWTTAADVTAGTPRRSEAVRRDGNLRRAGGYLEAVRAANQSARGDGCRVGRRGYRERSIAAAGDRRDSAERRLRLRDCDRCAGRRESTRVNPEALRDITSLTGGYTEVVKSAADLGPATERIADELNKQYTIGYSSSKPPDGGWRPLRVRVRTGGYFVRARRGYFAQPVR